MRPIANPEERLGRLYDREIVGRLVGYLLPYKRPLLGALLLMPVVSALRLVQPVLLMQAVDGPIAEHRPDGLAVYALLFLAALAIELSAQFGHMYLVQVAGQHAMRDLRRALFRHVQSLRIAFFHRTPVGRLITRMTNDVDSLNEMFAMGVVQLVGDLFTLVLIVAAMVAISPKLSLVTLVAVPPVVAFVLFCRIYLRSAFRAIRVRIARINAYLQEAVTGIAVIQVFGRQGASLREFDEINARHRNANYASIRWDAALYAFVEMVGSISIAALLWAAAGPIIEGTASFGVLVAFIEYLRKFFIPIRDVSAKFTVLQSAMASAERIFQLLDTSEHIEDPADGEAKALPEGPLAIELDDVHFAYKAGEPVLRGASLRVRPGERVAIVGPTGTGKTTITSLLLRLHDVDQGCIRVGGVDVRHLAKAELRQRFAVVLQDVFLFPGTVAENITLGHPGIDREKLLEACRAVHVDGLLERMEAGGGQEIRERGSNLSAGEKQLLSFARALCRDPDILILDEATSAVDSETEALIQDAVERLMEGRTSIVIAHRLSTIRKADRIVVLSEGRVQEEGTHEELLARHGMYWRLHRLQFAKQGVAAA